MSQTDAAGGPRISVFADTDGELLEGTPGLSEDFHFHVYFDPASRASTLAAGSMRAGASVH